MVRFEHAALQKILISKIKGKDDADNFLTANVLFSQNMYLKVKQ